MKEVDPSSQPAPGTAVYTQVMTAGSLLTATSVTKGGAKEMCPCAGVFAARQPGCSKQCSISQRGYQAGHGRSQQVSI